MLGLDIISLGSELVRSIMVFVALDLGNIYCLKEEKPISWMSFSFHFIAYNVLCHFLQF